MDSTESMKESLLAAKDDGKKLHAKKKFIHYNNYLFLLLLHQL